MMYSNIQESRSRNMGYGLGWDSSGVKPKSDEQALALLKRSKLLSRGGFQVVPQLFSKSALLAMFDEARLAFAQAREERKEGPDDEDWRGGVPARALLSTAGGPVQDKLYRAPALAALLSELIGVPVQASSNRASYSYYCRAGDHLALHRDVDQCDVTIIVAVSDNTDPKLPGGELTVFPDYVDEPMSAIRQNPDAEGISLKLAGGETCILAGGMVPHLVQPVTAGQYRITAPMCFKVVG